MKNILLVTIDSLRADHVGYHGYERDTTPTIDAHAKTGSRFMNAFAHVGGTRFSFPSILSGVTPMMHGGHRRISESQDLLSTVFDRAGYRTGGFHSNLYVSAEFGYDRGWDEFYDSSPNESTAASMRRWVKTNLKDSPVYPILQRAYDYMESSRGVNVGSYHVPADDITDRAIEFAEESSDEPTFIWVHYMDVHHPFLPPVEYQRRFRDEPIEDSESIQLRRKFIEEPEAVSERELQTFIDLYDAEIAFTDAEIGRLVDRLGALWDEEPLVALTADHGDHFLEHGFFGGARALDVKTHVPLYITGWNDEGAYDELVGLVDLPTTLVDAAGLSVPDTYQGYSLQTLVESGHWPREDVIGGWDNGEGDRTIGVREQDWKLIRRPDGNHELYHLATDPGEQVNVIEDHPEQVRRLERKLTAHLDRVAETREDDVERPDIGEEVKDRLRRLGYDE